MKYRNIYWFVIDSVRTYRTGLDDRDRIEIFDELAKDGTEFTHCSTGSPSSLLSAGSMFTGLPSTFVARHFNDWKFTGIELSAISDLKRNYNYEVYPILDTRDLREILHKLLPPLRHKDLPKGYKLSDYVWHNKDVTTIFQHYLKKQDTTKNHAYILWYDCRRDPRTNEYVKEAIRAIKEKGEYDDALIIMHSDHGYPDPRTELNEEYFKDIGHDMVLTDDNILVPLVIKTPNGVKELLREHQVGLVDLMPTIYDVLNIKYIEQNTSFQGKSLLPIINGNEEDLRIRKTDTRLPMDVKRIGCLRNNQYKYIYLYNDEVELLHDLANDPMELTNLSLNPEYSKQVEKFRKINLQYEEELFMFHDEQVKKNLSKSISQITKDLKTKTPKTVIVTKGIEILVNLLVNQLKRAIPSVEIDLIFCGGKKMNITGIKEVHYVNNLNNRTIRGLNLGEVDFTLFLTENTSRVFLKKSEIDTVKSIGATKSYLMNFNFELFNYFSSKWLNAAHVKLFFDWDTKAYFYKQEPTYFLKDLSIFIKYFFIKLRKSFSKKQADMDLKAAKEAVYYRKAILEMNSSSEYDEMDNAEYTNEIERLHVRNN